MIITFSLAYQLDILTDNKFEMLEYQIHTESSINQYKLNNIQAKVYGHTLEQEREFNNQKLVLLDKIINVFRYMRYFLLTIPSFLFFFADKKDSNAIARIGLICTSIAAIIFSITIHILTKRLDLLVKISTSQ